MNSYNLVHFFSKNQNKHFFFNGEFWNFFIIFLIKKVSNLGTSCSRTSEYMEHDKNKVMVQVHIFN
jgi:hypothetical protein